jgi:hypothetical protein
MCYLLVFDIFEENAIDSIIPHVIVFSSCISLAKSGPCWITVTPACPTGGSFCDL